MLVGKKLTPQKFQVKIVKIYALKFFWPSAWLSPAIKFFSSDVVAFLQQGDGDRGASDSGGGGGGGGRSTRPVGH
jgi:hypothetical protein